MKGVILAIKVETVKRLFSHLESGAGDQFFEHVADNVDWTVEGTHPLAGHYTSKREFQTRTFARLIRILPGGTQLHIEHVLTDGDWAVVELRSHAVAKDGMRFDNRYCWVTRFEGDTIVEVEPTLTRLLFRD